MSTEFDWLDAPAPAKPAKKRCVKKSARKAEKADRSIKPGQKIDHEPLRGRAMFQSVKGRKRIWACDGAYVFFRRKGCSGINPATGATETNTATIERHERFISKGDYTYVETQDDVEIYKVNGQSPFYRKEQFLGEKHDNEVRRTIELAAVKRDWVLYTDALTEMAGRIKNRGYHETQASQVWAEYLNYVEVMIANRGGPTPAECAAGLAKVRQQRGEGAGRVILLPGARA